MTKSRRIAAFLSLQKDRHCQVQKLRKSRRIVSFLTLSSSKTEEVSQNSCVFKLADRETDRQIDRQTDRQRERER